MSSQYLGNIKKSLEDLIQQSQAYEKALPPSNHQAQIILLKLPDKAKQVYNELLDYERALLNPIKYVTYQKLCVDGKRRLIEIVKMNGYRDDHYDLQPIYKYDEEQATFVVIK